MRGAVLKRLKGADLDAELLALLEIIDRAGEAFPRDAEHLCGEARASGIEDAVEDGRTVAGRTEHVCPINLHVGQRHARGVAAVDHRPPRNGDPGSLGIDQKQRDSCSLIVGPTGPRGDDQRVGDMTVEDECLRAVELEAIA